jgi:hypothetical protein
MAEDERSLTKKPDDMIIESESTPEESLLKKYLGALKKYGFLLTPHTVMVRQTTYDYKRLPNGQRVGAEVTATSFLQPQRVSVPYVDPMELLDIPEANSLRIALSLFDPKKISGSGNIRKISYTLDLRSGQGLRKFEREGEKDEIVDFDIPGVPEDFENLDSLGNFLILDRLDQKSS